MPPDEGTRTTPRPERWLTDVHVISPGGGPPDSLCENGILGSRWTINPAKATCPECLAAVKR